MDGFPAQNRFESGVERRARIERENAIIAKAEANIAAGLGIDGDAAFEWLKALDLDENASSPASIQSR